MTDLTCRRCGHSLPEGCLWYELELRVRTGFDRVIPDSGSERTAQDIDDLVTELSRYSEEELLRQVYQNDVLVLCPPCKEALLHDIYACLKDESPFESDRTPLIQ